MSRMRLQWLLYYDVTISGHDIVLLNTTKYPDLYFKSNAESRVSEVLRRMEPGAPQAANGRSGSCYTAQTCRHTCAFIHTRVDGCAQVCIYVCTYYNMQQVKMYPYTTYIHCSYVNLCKAIWRIGNLHTHIHIYKHIYGTYIYICVCAYIYIMYISHINIYIYVDIYT